MAVTQEDLDQLKSQIAETLEAQSKQIWGIIKILQHGQDALDQQVATLATAFGEQAVLLESLVGQLRFSSPEEREAFYESQRKGREEMLRIMREGADAISGDDPRVAAAMEKMAGGNKTPSPD